LYHNHTGEDQDLGRGFHMEGFSIDTFLHPHRDSEAFPWRGGPKHCDDRELIGGMSHDPLRTIPLR
jgi:hypothetical protein